MRIHLIAIGGSAMHNMALALHQKGFEVTGSDDAIFSPSKERLQNTDFYQMKWAGFLIKSLLIWMPLF